MLFQLERFIIVNGRIAADSVFKKDPLPVFSVIALSAYKILIVILIGDGCVTGPRKNNKISVFVEIALLCFSALVIVFPQDFGITRFLHKRLFVLVKEGNMDDIPRRISLPYNMRIAGREIHDRLIIFIQPQLFQLQFFIQIRSCITAGAVRERDPVTVRPEIPFRADKTPVVIFIGDTGIAFPGQDHLLSFGILIPA